MNKYNNKYIFASTHISIKDIYQNHSLNGYGTFVNWTPLFSTSHLYFSFLQKKYFQTPPHAIPKTNKSAIDFP